MDVKEEYCVNNILELVICYNQEYWVSIIVVFQQETVKMIFLCNLAYENFLSSKRRYMVWIGVVKKHRLFGDHVWCINNFYSDVWAMDEGYKC